MFLWQKILIASYGLGALLGFVSGFRECSRKKNAYGTDKVLNLYGAFVWGDIVVFGLFWTMASLLVIYLNDWVLFLLLQSVFWLVKSVGETIYWLNEQFAVKKRNPPEKFWFYKYFKNDSVHFVYQIYWQCITVISAIFTLYFAKLWLSGV